MFPCRIGWYKINKPLQYHVKDFCRYIVEMWEHPTRRKVEVIVELTKERDTSVSDIHSYEYDLTVSETIIATSVALLYHEYQWYK